MHPDGVPGVAVISLAVGSSVEFRLDTVSVYPGFFWYGGEGQEVNMTLTGSKTNSSWRFWSVLRGENMKRCVCYA